MVVVVVAAAVAKSQVAQPTSFEATGGAPNDDDVAAIAMMNPRRSRWPKWFVAGKATPDD